MNPSHFVVPDIEARKNKGLSYNLQDFTLPQPLERYQADDHATWALLYRRQSQLLPGRACEAFMQGLSDLGLNEDQVPEFARLNQTLQSATGWQIVAVPGLIPDEVFFTHLAHRRFPVTWWLREPQQLDYLQEPDVFHDLFGHIPLLLNPVFADYLQAYGQGGVKALSLGALPLLARLYWYTVEFGLLRTEQGLRIYGAGILSSQSESIYCLESNIPHRLGFDLKRIMCTRYQIDKLQSCYFVIRDFQQLFSATEVDFSPIYQQLLSAPELEATAILASDEVC